VKAVKGFAKAFAAGRPSRLLQAGGRRGTSSRRRKLATLAQRIAKNVVTLTSADDNRRGHAATLSKDAPRSVKTLATLSRSATRCAKAAVRGATMRAHARGDRETGDQARRRASPRLDQRVATASAKQAARTIGNEGEPLYADTTKLARGIRGQRQDRTS
jgi:hypothetical protein